MNKITDRQKKAIATPSVRSYTGRHSFTDSFGNLNFLFKFKTCEIVSY